MQQCQLHCVLNLGGGIALILKERYQAANHFGGTIVVLSLPLTSTLYKCVVLCTAHRAINFARCESTYLLVINSANQRHKSIAKSTYTLD